MSQHHATVSWECAPGEFRRNRFSRNHSWEFEDGLKLSASASAAVIPAPWSDSSAIDPEQALVAALASCHMMSYLFLANRADIEVLAYRDSASGTLGRDTDGRECITRVTLRPEVTYGAQTDAGVEQKRHQEAHRLCYIANTLRCEVLIEPR